MNDDLFNDNEFNAAVQLPDGAIITSITGYWADNSSSNAILSLKRTEFLQGNIITMATQSTNWNSSAYTPKTTSSISNATIDNSNYYYFLRLGMPNTSNLLFYGVKLEYTFNTIQ